MEIFNTKTDIINWSIKNFSYKRYLEIGVFNINGEFQNIKCDYKICVDPKESAEATYIMTSDEFFSRNNETFDIILIDGMHMNDYVYRDIENSLKILNTGGMIVLHDCLPENEDMQKVPSCTIAWTGDVWKGFLRSREKYNEDYLFFVNNIDFGVGVIKKSIEKQEKFIINKELNWNNLVENKKEWLNLIDTKDFKNYLKKTV